MVHLWKFVGSIFSLRVSWSPGHDNPAKNYLQLPGTDVVDKLARIVGAGANKGEWWTRPFSLDEWGEDAFVAKLQGVSTAKRARISMSNLELDQRMSTNVQLGVGPTNIYECPTWSWTNWTNTQNTRQQNRAAAQLPAFHPPCRLSSEGSVLTSLGNFTKIIAKNAETFGKKPGEIFQTNSYHRPPPSTITIRSFIGKILFQQSGENKSLQQRSTVVSEHCGEKARNKH